MKTANMTVRHELISVSHMLIKGADRHGKAPFLLPVLLPTDNPLTVSRKR